MINAKPEEQLNRKIEGCVGSQREEGSESIGRTVLWILVSGACYYLATQIAWALCFPDSKVSLFFPPHAVLVSVLLLVPTRHWWAYTLIAIGGHFVATQQAHWPSYTHYTARLSTQCRTYQRLPGSVSFSSLR